MSSLLPVLAALASGWFSLPMLRLSHLLRIISNNLRLRTLLFCSPKTTANSAMNLSTTWAQLDIPPMLSTSMICQTELRPLLGSKMRSEIVWSQLFSSIRYLLEATPSWSKCGNLMSLPLNTRHGTKPWLIASMMTQSPTPTVTLAPIGTTETILHNAATLILIHLLLQKLAATACEI
jgi:hypothetical protein